MPKKAAASRRTPKAAASEGGRYTLKTKGKTAPLKTNGAAPG